MRFWNHMQFNIQTTVSANFHFLKSWPHIATNTPAQNNPTLNTSKFLAYLFFFFFVFFFFFKVASLLLGAYNLGSFFITPVHSYLSWLSYYGPGLLFWWASNICLYCLCTRTKIQLWALDMGFFFFPLLQVAQYKLI